MPGAKYCSSPVTLLFLGLGIYLAVLSLILRWWALFPR